MARRLATPLTAYVIAVVTVLLLAASIPLAHIAKVSSTDSGLLFALVGFLVVGLILVRQRPQNPIGWAMLVSALLGGTTGVASPYAIAAYRLHPLVLQTYRLNDHTVGTLFHLRQSPFTPLPQGLQT